MVWYGWYGMVWYGMVWYGPRTDQVDHDLDHLLQGNVNSSQNQIYSSVQT